MSGLPSFDFKEMKMQFKFDSLKIKFEAERADGTWLTAFVGCAAATMSLLQEWDNCSRLLSRMMAELPDGGEPPESMKGVAELMMKTQEGLQDALTAYASLLTLRLDPEGTADADASDPMIGVDPALVVPMPTQAQ